MDYLQRTAYYTAIVEKKLDELLSSEAVPASLSTAMRYSVSAGGKRLRPCLVMAAAEIAGGSAEDVVTIAAGIELIHTYSLIHDDMPCMDNDDYRRGKPSNHKVFGEAAALLAGDGLLSLAFEGMLGDAVKNNRPSCYTAAIYEIAKGAGVCGMVAGQADDLKNETEQDRTYDMLRRIHERKTGAMIKAALLAGARAVNAPEDTLKCLAEFGDNYGLLFQITDDVLDCEGDIETLGKSTGKDARDNKLTYVTLFGLKEAKIRAAEAAAAAFASLVPLNERAWYLHALTELTLTREK